MDKGKKQPLGMYNLIEFFPPIVCRILARNKSSKGREQRPLSEEEISEGSGLPIPVVRSLSHACSWDKIPVELLIKFSKGCNIDLGNETEMRRHLKTIRRTNWLSGQNYLRRSRDWPKHKVLIEEYIDSLKQQ